MTRMLLGCVLLSFLYACGGGGSGGGGSPAPANSGGGGGNASGSSAPPPSDTGWSIPQDDIVDPGPGRNGIPALNFPAFVSAREVDLFPGQFVLGVSRKGSVRAYPHNILDWHEVVNDSFDGETHVLSYCPLTATGMFWESNASSNETTWGVSGLLYNSNLILFDRETDTNWVQMLEEAVEGPRRGEVPVRHKVLEMTWAAWQAMYPDSQVLSDNTGFDRDYTDYPYLSHRTDDNLLFPVTNEDNRLHPKERVVGIRHSSGRSRVYQIDAFDPGLHVINTSFEGVPIVVVGSGDMRFGTIYERRTADGVSQIFTAVEGELPVVMRDQEGNRWDVFGRAVSGPRSGEDLPRTDSYTAFWFAWAAFYPNAEIFF